MSVYVGHPTLKDGVPPLTDRQEKRLNEWLTEIRDRLGMYVPGPHSLNWQARDEYRKGRGHDVEAIAVDGEHIAWLYIDVYGNGHDGYGDITVTHNGANDECQCNECEDFRDED